MSVSGRVEAIHVTASAGQAMISVPHARALAGAGLEGDRYARGTGHWSAIRRAGDGLTLIEAEVIEAVAAGGGPRLAPGAARRNITTRGVRLDELVGHRFRIGEVDCRAVRRCEPCSYLDGLLSEDVLAHLIHRGGIRAEILTDGTFAVGDRIEIP